MAEHSEDGRLLVVDKRTGETYRELPHIIERAAHLEYAPSTKARLKAKAEREAKEKADAEARAAAEEKNRAKATARATDDKNQGK